MKLTGHNLPLRRNFLKLICIVILLCMIAPVVDAVSLPVTEAVLCCCRFGTEEEALSIANSADVGLAAYLFTENISQVS